LPTVCCYIHRQRTWNVLNILSQVVKTKTPESKSCVRFNPSWKPHLCVSRTLGDKLSVDGSHTHIHAFTRITCLDSDPPCDISWIPISLFTISFELTETHTTPHFQHNDTRASAAGAEQKPTQAPSQTCHLLHLRRTCRRQFRSVSLRMLRYHRRVHRLAPLLLAAATLFPIHQPAPSIC
jgi:hypothetical protein